MNRGFVILILTLCSVIAVISCSNHGTNPRLIQAESLMQEHPDSALKILESVDVNSFNQESDIALYGLLYTQALDKNHLLPTEDSLISASVNYYRSYGDKMKQVLSNYYQGRVRYNANNNQSAIVCFYKAMEIAEDNGSDFWVGMCSRGISDIYNETYNAAEELFYAQKEYDHIKKSHHQPYLNYAMHDLGRALRNNGRNDKSIKIAEQLTDSAVTYKDDFLYNSALQLKAYNLIDVGKIKESYDLLSEICEGDYAETIDTLYLCNTLFEMGYINEAANVLEKTSNQNLPLKSQLRYRIAKTFQNYSEAIKEAEFIDSLLNADFKLAMSHNLTTSIAEYYNLNKKVDEAEIRSSRIMNWAIIITSLAIISIMMLVGWYIYNLQNKKISEKVLLANQLQEELSKSKQNNTNSTDIIKSLMSTKYELLEELSSIVLRNNDTKVARKKIADTVTRIIEKFSIRSEKIVALEDKVDSLYNNLMSDFKIDLPNLKEVDYRLFLFSVLGLSNATISLFLKEDKIDAVYNRKRRLKDKIKQLDSTKAGRYLAYFM